MEMTIWIKFLKDAPCTLMKSKHHQGFIDGEVNNTIVLSRGTSFLPEPEISLLASVR